MTTRTASSVDAKATAKGERIAKALSRAGVCSRRDAERLIAEGRVAVDGAVLASPATLVTAGSRIEVDGRAIGTAAPARLWRYHKPPGVLCTSRDPEGRPTVFDRLPKDMPRVMLVGRLDVGSEGLLLLTNDGGLARRLELPQTGWARRYRVRVFGTPGEGEIAALARGVTVDGVRYGPIQLAVDRVQGSNAWITVTLREGKNREIRRVMEHFGHPVGRLIRVSFGPFQLGALPRDAVEPVPAKVLADQLGRPEDGAREGPRAKHADRRR
jgi:23S rRNA pseudouridine2605 synthase